MPVVDVVDDTFCRATRAVVRGRTGTRWTSWLPDLELVVAQDRGEAGTRWTARTSTAAGAVLAGRAEVWLEEVPGGTVAHLYVRLDPVAGEVGVAAPRRARAGAAARRAGRLPDRLRRSWKRGVHAFKDSLEGDAAT